MKKFLLLGAMGVLLAGCSDSNGTEQSGSADDSTPALEENDVNTPSENEQEAEQQASGQADSDASQDAENTVPAGDAGGTDDDTADASLEGFEEYSTVRDAAPVDGLKGMVETDNPNTRVILYADEAGKKKVKSVFVKRENRLKVISLDDDGLLYDDVLK